MVAAMRSALAGPLLLLSTAAFTQEVRTASSDSSVTELQEVVVTGIRKSLEDALDDKRNAPQVVDVISAEDIGKFRRALLQPRLTGFSRPVH